MTNESEFIERLSSAAEMHNLAESFHNRALDSSALSVPKIAMTNEKEWYEAEEYAYPGNTEYNIPKIVAEAEKRGEVKAWEEMDKIWDLEQSRRYPLYEVMLELRGRIVKKLTSLKNP